MNTQFPFNWPEKTEANGISVTATHADLLALESQDLREKVVVRCKLCDGRVGFSDNWQDPNESQYACYGVTTSSYVVYGDDHCYNKIKRWELAKTTEQEVGRRFYVQINFPEKKSYRMCYEPNGPTTGYHYVREVTKAELEEEAEKELDRIRKKAIEEVSAL